MSLYMSRNRACDSRTEGRNRCDHHVLTNCRAPAPRWKTQEMSDVSALPSTHRKPGGMAASFAVRHVRVRCGGTGTPAESREHGSSASLARAPTTCHLTKQRQGRGATTSGRATAAEVSSDRQIDPQDQFANGVIPQVLPPQSGSFCHRRWSFSTPSRAADTAREGHSGSGESDLGDMDSYAKVLDRVPRRLSEG